MNPIQEQRVPRERMEEADRVENQVAGDMVKVITVALAALALGTVIDSLGNRESCVAWNNKMDPKEEEFSKELDKAVQIENKRNKDVDVANEAKQDELEKQSNLTWCRLYTPGKCKKEESDLTAAHKKALKAKDIFQESDKRYRNSMRHINNLKGNIEYHRQQKPIFCFRKHR
jgi:hypothetical protein